MSSDLFDNLMMIAGLVLTTTGLLMFVYSKAGSQASSVEAFGIKLNVTHPSLILVLTGVGLMLAPRLLPDHRPAIPPQAAVPTQSGSAAPSAPAAAPDGSSSSPSAGAEPAASQVIAGKTPAPAPSRPPKMPRPPAVAAPAAHAPAAPSPVASSPTTEAARAPARPAAVETQDRSSPPVTPRVVVAALAQPDRHAFWSGETPARYGSRVTAALQHAARDVLAVNASELAPGQTAFDAWWNESAQHPRSRALCGASPRPVALLSARVETPTTFSTVESAYWPELKLRLFVCATGRLYRQQKTLAPQNEDAWPFAADLDAEIERFLRANRDAVQAQ